MSDQFMQWDHKVRYVGIENLKAMCERVSGYSHRFDVEKITKSRVHVKYTNPDEYGVNHPMTAIFPAYPNGGGQTGVVLDYLRIMHDSWYGEGWQAFEILLDCPELYRCPDGQWRTKEEIEKSKG